MKVIYTDAHLGHNPQQEIAESGSHSPHEHTARAENIRETLQSDATMQLQPPTQWGVEPINAVHNPGLNNFLTTDLSSTLDNIELFIKGMAVP